MRQLRRFVLISITALLLPSLSAAQSTWNGAANNLWSVGGVGGNWSDGPAPVSSSSAVIIFDGNLNAVTNQNIVPTFQLNTVRLGTSVASTTEFFVTGGALQFAGTGANITIDAGGSGGWLRINSAVDFSVDTIINPRTGHSVGHEIVLGGNLTANTGTTVTVGQATSVVGGVTVLAGANNLNFNGTWSVTNNQQLQIFANNAVFRGAAVNVNAGVGSFLAGTTATTEVPTPEFADTGVSLQIGSVQVDSGSFTVGTTVSPSTVQAGYSNTSTSIVAGSGLTAGNVNSTFMKVGTGTLTYGGSGSFVGNVVIRDGVFNSSGNTGSAGGFSNATNGNLRVYSGSTFALTMTGSGTNDRMGNGFAVTLVGGTFRQNQSAVTTAAGNSVTYGTLSVASGQSIYRLDNAAAKTHRASITNLGGSTNGATLFVQTTNLGVNILGDNVAGGNLFFGTGVATTSQFIGGGITYGAATTNLSILPYAFAATSPTGAPATFITYDTSSNRGMRALIDSNYAGAFGTATDNINLTADVTTTATANSLRMNGASAFNLSLEVNLTLTAGGLLNINTDTVTASQISGNTLISGQSFLFATTNNGLAISSQIQTTGGTTGGLSKNGAGNLTLSNAVTLNGSTANIVAVNAGTLTLASGASFTGTGVVFQVGRYTTDSATNASANAILDVSSTGLVIGTGRTIRGNGTVNAGSNALTIAAGGKIEASALGGGSTNLSSPGTLTVNNLTLQADGTYIWNIASVYGKEYGTTTTGPTATQEYTQSLINVTGVLDITSLSSTDQFDIQVKSLLLNYNTGSVYDFDQNQNYVWTIATYGTLSGTFSSDKFNVDTSTFTNSFTGTFSVINGTNALLLTYTSPIPEPATALLIGAAGLGVGGYFRRRFRGRREFENPVSTAI